MPKPKHSLIDIIGRLSDTVAKIGGSTPMYQSSLDADTARANAASDHDLATQKAQLDLATGKFDLSDKQREAGNNERERFANVLGAVNDPDDAANLPAMMAAAGLTDPRYAPFVKLIQANPDAAKTLSSALGGDSGDDVGKQIKSGYDSKGNRISYVVDSDGNPHILSGVTPDNNLKVVNTGDTNVVLGADGKPVTTLKTNISPNVIQQTSTQKQIASGHDATQIQIAGMPARAKPGGTGGAVDGMTAYNAARTGLSNLSDQIDRIIGDPGLAQATGLAGSVERHIPGTPAQRVLGNITTLKGQALTAAIQNLKALSANGNLGFRLTQQEANAFASQMAGALENTSQSPTDYANNLRAAQGRIKTMIQQLDEDAARKSKSAPSTGNSDIPTLSPSDAMKLAPGKSFRTLDGRLMVRH
jgi:hypothetical protein